MPKIKKNEEDKFTRQLNCKVKESTHEKFESAAKNEGLTTSEKLRKLIVDTVGE